MVKNIEKNNNQWEVEFDKYISLAENEEALKEMDTPEKLRDYVKGFIRTLLQTTRREYREAIREEIEKFTVYYRSKYSPDCSREETEKEKETEMIELTDLLSFLDGLEGE